MLFPSPKVTIERKKVKSLSRVRFFATPWTAAHQAPPSMEFSRQEYWRGLPFPSPLVDARSCFVAVSLEFSSLLEMAE